MKSHAVTSPSRSGTRGLRGALAGLAALLGLGACATEADAQYVYGYTYARPLPGPAFYGDDVPPISPRGVVFRLQDRGFSEIARPRFDGTAWIVDATNPAGDRVRLFVDARTGGIIGRQRLDAPYYPSNRVARAAPGYGWTEDDAGRAQNPDHLLPPGSIPEPGYGHQAAIDRMPPRSGAAPGSAPRATMRPLPGASANAGENNPTGINPDARGESAHLPAAPRKTAKLTTPAKPAAPRTSPDAPRPSTAEQAKSSAPVASEPAKAATQPEPSKPEQPSAVTPATNQPTAATPAASNAEKPVAEKAAEKPAAKEWQDPPASEPKRNVRVIGGATVVPGGGGEAPSGAN